MESSLIGTYFPFTYITSPLVESLAVLLDRVIVFRPAGLREPHTQALQPWIDKGFLDLRPFSTDPAEEVQLLAQFQEWKNWGQMHEKSQDMTAAKYMGDRLPPSSPVVPAMVSAIKGTEKKEKNRKNDYHGFHLFLCLAHDFDRQSLEVTAQLSQIKKQRESLKSFLQIDAYDTDGDSVWNRSFVDAPQDLGFFMTETRITAWDRLVRREGGPTDILITDSRAAFEFFLDAPQDKVEIGRFPLFVGKTPSESKSRQTDLRDLLFMLLNTPWDIPVKNEMEKAAQPLKETSGDTGPEYGAITGSIQWYLVPGPEGKRLFQTSEELFQEEKKPERSHQNRLVGFISVRPK